jgi:2-dehydropantoate 2-reductase
VAASSEPRSVAVVGAGGVGGLLGGMLARAGVDVRMLVRGAALEAIRARGIRVVSPGGAYTAPVARASASAVDLGVADLVLVTVKTWQLPELAPQLVPLVGERTIVVPLQNGVEASEQLAVALGDDPVVGGAARVISWIERPGEIRRVDIPTSLTIGLRRPGPTADLDACAATLVDAGIEVVVTDAIESARWMKFLFIAPYSAIGAVERMSLGELRSTPRTRAMLQASMRELTAVAVARGVVLPEDAVDSTQRFLDSLPADATSSMHRDIAAGRPSELDALIGALVRLGGEAYVATPVSGELYRKLEPLERHARAGAT